MADQSANVWDETYINNTDFIRADGSHVFVDYRDFSGEGTAVHHLFGQKSAEPCKIHVEYANRRAEQWRKTMRPSPPIEGCVGTIGALEKRTESLESPPLEREAASRDFRHVARLATWHPLAEFAEIRGPSNVTLRVGITDGATHNGIGLPMGQKDFPCPIYIGHAISIEKCNDLAGGVAHAYVSRVSWVLALG